MSEPTPNKDIDSNEGNDGDNMARTNDAGARSGSDPDVPDEPSAPQLRPDEVFCQSCGEAIKQEAEICPHCGVRQTATTDSSADGFDISDRRRYELEQMAAKDTTTVMLVGFLLSPAGYLMVGKTGLAILNFITFNYFLLGFIVVPLHTRKMITDSRAELSRAGIGGY